MEKTIAILSVLVLFSGVAVSQPVENTAADNENILTDTNNTMMPDAAGAVSGIPDKAANMTASIPEAASDTAQSVTGAVSNGLSNAATSIGETISSLFQ